jgi:DMSO/TMAO reductase YedYZ molybdopterin-dependent catalytic subunit
MNIEGENAMLKHRFALILIVVLLLSACQPATVAAPTSTPLPPTAILPTAIPPTNTPVPTPTAVPPTETPAAPVLELIGADGASTPFTLGELMALPATSGQAGIKSSTGKITPPSPFKGVSLKDLVAQLGNFDDTMGVSVEASDGYAITFSYDQVMNGGFTEYDPGTGDELKAPVPVTVMLAYEMNGAPLNSEQDGALRVVIASDEPKQVTDGHWSVKFVTKVTAKSLGEEWFLELHGTTKEKMDRATFESGASPNCHGVTWTDDKAQNWVGIPLWLLVGRVDDTIKHEGPAFNDTLADMGYTVDVIATDGYTVSFDAAKIKRNDNILVANTVDGNPLPEKYFPLRLVGSDLAKNEMVGMISQIVVHTEGMTIPLLTPGTTVAPTETITSTSAADLVVSGLVKNPLSLTEADLRGMEVEKITAEHPKKGPQEYEGVRLSKLLEMAGVDSAAKKLVLTAGDGFSAEVFLTEAAACQDCMVAFTDTPGELFLVMPGLPGNVWIKDITTIDLQ